jgi:hypothetical protein
VNLVNDMNRNLGGTAAAELLLWPKHRTGITLKQTAGLSLRIMVPSSCRIDQAAVARAGPKYGRAAILETFPFYTEQPDVGQRV